MPIRTACSCGKVINAPDHLAGKRVKCPGCGQPLAVPGGGAPAQGAATPQGKPSQPKGSPPQPARPAQGMGQPGMAPGGFQQPPQQAAFGGVADLINEEIGRQVKAQIKAEEDELREQELEKSRAAYLAPKLKAIEMQRKGLKKADSRPLDLGKTFSRSWRVFKEDWGRLMGVTWTGFFLSVIPAVLLTLPLLLLVGVLAALIGDALPRFMVAIIVAFLMFILMFLVPGALVAWMMAGTTNYVLGRIKGKEMEFLDLFRAGSNMLSTWGGMIYCMLFGLIPFVPYILTIVAIIVEAKTIPDADIRLQVVRYTAMGGLALTGVLYVVSFLLILKSSFFSFAIVDKNGTAGDGIGISQALCAGNLGKVFLLYLASGMLGQLSMLTLGLGLIPLLPYQLVLWGTAYAEMSGIAEPQPAAVAPPAAGFAPQPGH
ncbi:MAG: hypothetical protein AB7O62_04145 [Pirellulales bacterium]